MNLEYSFNRLEEYLIREEYKGYDPYDTLNSWIPFKYLGKWPSAIAIQIQKRNPINLRRLLGVKKEVNPKGFGLFLQSYSLLFRKTGNQEYLIKAKYFFEWLKNNYSKGYSGVAWGYNFPWSNPDKYLDSYIPSAVVTGFVAKGVFEYYWVSKDEEAIHLMESLCEFLDKDLEKVQDDSGISISYTPVIKDVCFNASLLAAEAFAKTYSINKDFHLKELALQSVEFVLDKQKEDGHWNYSMSTDLKREQIQIDFHQGYILESIYEILKVLNITNKAWVNTLIKGLDFYIENQFDPRGISFWRLPKKYPIEIHNQSQGIITMQKLKNFNPKARLFANKIAHWTCNNMQGSDGHFYYQKSRNWSNKISYLRWSQAWMFLALTNLIVDNE